ncbi:hypothetical protein SSX86_019172 [Deinandra increscens subsp. villosa]|uniref:Cupin type-1 domain-containing protein n=1 Tax=Deinandra increscens subsp. villosa TaxID=3103831 RepID=A0AAP0CZ99_9ASTR
MRVNNSFSVCLVLSAYFVIHILICFPPAATAGYQVAGPVPVSDGPTVSKDERWPLVSSEFGEISAVKISDGEDGCYYLQFITMNPGSLFLPVYLHSEMLLYVNSGSGTLSWMNVEEDDDKRHDQVMLRRGDIYRLTTGTVFYLQNNLNYSSYEYYQLSITRVRTPNTTYKQNSIYFLHQLPQKLQIHAIFPGSEVHLHNDRFIEVYTGVHELVLGFDNQVLQSTFNVPEEVIEELKCGENQPLIVEGQSTSMWEQDGSWGLRSALQGKTNKKQNKKIKPYNIFKADHDVDTCFGWSTIVTSRELDVLKHTDFGVFMVNLTKGSMMAPHLNPTADEVAVVLNGQGVIQVVCPGIAGETECKNSRLMVEEGDVFVVPRYHPMAQISFNNDSFVFMGFMRTLKNESPQYLAGKLSIFQRLDRKVLEKSFNVRNTTIDWVLSNEKKETIYECVSCAEEEVTGKSEQGGGWQTCKEGRGRGGERQADKGGRRGGGEWQADKGGRRGGGERQADKGGRRGGGEWQADKGGRRGGGEWQADKGVRRGGDEWREWKADEGEGGWQKM